MTRILAIALIAISLAACGEDRGIVVDSSCDYRYITVPQSIKEMWLDEKGIVKLNAPADVRKMLTDTAGNNRLRKKRCQ